MHTNFPIKSPSREDYDMLLGNRLKAVLLLYQGGDNREETNERKHPGLIRDQTLIHLEHLASPSADH